MMAQGNNMPRYLLLLVVFCAFFANQQCNGEFLRVSGNNFYYGSERVFLSGANIAWVFYGWDFGNGNYASTRELLEGWIRDISAAGGNSLRMWVHVEGDSTPHFDDYGYVVGTDAGNNLVRDLSLFLDIAEQYNVFVIFSLWNGASIRNDNFRNLFLEDSKLDSYINYALRPMIEGLNEKPALGGWEIINEPEGALLVEANEQRCFDTTRIPNAGGSGANIPMQRMLHFVNRQAAAIHRYGRGKLVTVGCASEYTATSAFNDTYNHFSQYCLELGGNDPTGSLDFYQVHSYAWFEHPFSTHSPLRQPAEAFQLERPIVIGEFAAVCSEGLGTDYIWNHGYEHGYAGLWSWQYNLDMVACQDTQAAQNQGMNLLRYRDGVPVDIH